MKYLRYIAIIAFKLFAKVFGLVWYWVAVPFRAYARNTVHNYVLGNGVYLNRLEEREPTLVGSGYQLKDVHHVKDRNDKNIVGFIKYRKVSWLEYQLVFWLLWGWVDDDSNHDTMSGGQRDGMVYGNTFDLGDVRGQYPEFEWKESTAWLVRNTAYNFNYMFEEIAENSKYNFYYKFNKLGWHFGFIPYTNSTRQGRMVWFSEDYNKLDK